jgi:LPPG:FO 2-phospho-L-lactate transferase
MLRLTALAGGVGASRFLQGVLAAYPDAELTIISNTGDDVEMHGLHVSPDTDIVIYALAGAVDPEKGWGLAGDTFNLLDAMRRFAPDDVWFNVGDRDLATHLYRTRRLREGVSLSTVTAEIAAAFDLRCRVVPMSDSPVETRVCTTDGELAFQDYMVRLRTEPEVTGIHFRGADTAEPAPGVLEAIASAQVILVAPSNPLVSVGPILAVPGVRDALRATPAVCAAVSPIVGGGVIKGPADRMLRGLGYESSAVEIARLYKDFLDVLVIDEQDAALAAAVDATGVRCIVTDTIMANMDKKLALARTTVEAALAPG